MRSLFAFWMGGVAYGGTAAADTVVHNLPFMVTMGQLKSF